MWPAASFAELSGSPELERAHRRDHAQEIVEAEVRTFPAFSPGVSNRREPGGSTGIKRLPSIHKAGDHHDQQARPLRGLRLAHAFGSGVAQKAAAPNDAQIAHIAYTAGQLDLDAGKQALAKSHNKAVRSFAETMVRDHGAVNDQALALVKKLHVTPQDNATSEALTKQAKDKARELAKLRGHAFDRAYIQNEVAFHRTVNGALKTTLIPSAHNAELKSLLETGLTLFQEHQKHAEQLATNLR